MRPVATGTVQLERRRRALGRIAAAREIPAMNVRVEVICVGVDGTEERRDVMRIDRAQLVMETLGMNLKEGKALLERVQKLMIAHQVHEYLEQHRLCPACGKRRTS